MATITSLGFSIFSRYDGTGVTRANRDINDLHRTIERTNGGLNSFTGRMTAAVAATVSLAPALLPIAEAAGAVAGGLTAMGVTAGTALGVYAAAAKGAIDRTLQMAEAGQKLSPVQTTFVRNVDAMRAAWNNFIIAHEPQTLQSATIVVQALTSAIGQLSPIVNAVHPIVKSVALAFQDWVDRTDGLQRFVGIVVQFGVPALRNLVQAGRDVLAVLGIAFRSLLPLVIPLSEAIAQGAARLREWAEDGGFTRFLDRVRANAPLVLAFLQSLWPAFQNIMNVVRMLSPASLALATALAQIVAAVPPGVLAAIAVGFLTLRVISTLVNPVMLLALHFTGIGTAMTTLVPLLLRLAGLVGAFVTIVTLAWQHSAFFREQVTLLWQQIQVLWQQHLQPLIQQLQLLWEKLQPLREAIGFVAGLILGVFVSALTNAIVILGQVITALTNTISFFDQLITKLAEVAAQIAGWVAQTASAFAGWVAQTASAFAGWVAQTASAFAGWVAQTASAFAGWVAQTASAIASWVAQTASAIASWVAQTVSAIASWVAQTVAQIASWASQTVSRITAWIAQTIALFTGWINNIITAIAGWVTRTVQQFAQWITDTINRLRGWAGDMLTIVRDWIADVLNAMGQFASDLINRLEDCWTTIRDTAADLWGEIVGVIEDAINALLTPINLLIDGFNAVGNVFGLPDVPNIEVNFAEGGVLGERFARGGVANLSRGGALGGYSPGRDTVPAMLSPGEGVLVPEAVRGLGGAGFVHSANRYFSNGRAGKHSRGGWNWRRKRHDKRPGSWHGGGMDGHYAFGGMVPVQHFAVGGITAAALARAGVSLGMVTQGEFSNGSLSAGTHLGGGAVDIASGSPAVLARLRAAGFAAWIRTPAQGFATHIHAVLIGHPQLSAAAAAQVADYLAGGDGLGIGGGGGGGISFADMIASMFPNPGETLRRIVELEPISEIFSNLGGGGGDDDGGGGFFDSIVDTVTDIANPFNDDNPVTDTVADVASDLIGGMGSWLHSLMTMPILNFGFGLREEALDGMSQGDFWFGDLMHAMGAGGENSLLEGAKQFILDQKPSPEQIAEDFGGAFGSTGTQQWAGLAAVALARAGIAASQLGAFLSLMAAESGGNPMAINTTDINAQRGDPSRGLMQVIGATFARYRDPSLPNNIFDPLANMVAAARYIADRYGGIVPGSPYGLGTPGATAGWHMVGERGPEWVKFRGGEQVLPNGTLPPGGGSGAQSISVTMPITVQGNLDSDAVDRLEREVVPNLTILLEQGTGRR